AVRILATLLRMDEGRATVGGYDVATQAHQVRQLIGLTGQYASVDETLTGVENLLLIGRLLGMPKREAKARARELLGDFELFESGRWADKTFSGFIRRGAALAASLWCCLRILVFVESLMGPDLGARLVL